MTGRPPRPDAGLTAAELRAWRGVIETTALLRYRLDKLLMADSGLSGSDYPILVALYESEQPQLRSSELADRIGWERSRLSHHLGRMESRGLVRRERCADDSRGSEILMTPAGAERFRRASAPHLRAVQELFVDAFSPDLLDRVDEITRSLRRHLDELGQEAKAG